MLSRCPLDLSGRRKPNPDFLNRTFHTLALLVLIVLLLATWGCSGVSSSSGSGGSGGTNHNGTKNTYPTPAPGLTGSFFGIATNSLKDPWPGTMIPVSSWRSLGSQVKWADINTAPGAYDFSHLDKYLSRVKSTQGDVLFTTYATPSWVSSRGPSCTGVGTPYSGCLGPPNPCAFLQQNGPGVCDPPIDLACDGTGTNQTFINFVSALIQHVGPGTIKYWEMWNEPSNPKEWNGAADCPNTPNAEYLMLARMAKDLKATVSAVDPNALFATPPLGSPTDAANWLPKYFANTDAASVTDIIGFHGYITTGLCPNDCPQPEKFASALDELVSALPASEVGKPLFDTEGDWGGVRQADGTRIEAITDPDQRASFVARYYLIQMSKGVAKFYWWNWDIYDNSPLYDPSTNSLNPAADAYVQIVRWTNGGTATVQACTATGTVWTCPLSFPNGTSAEAIWDTSQTCSGGTCSSVDQTVPSQFNAYLDLSGNTTNLSGSSAAVGFKPILLITQ